VKFLSDWQRTIRFGDYLDLDPDKGIFFGVLRFPGACSLIHL